MARYNPTLNDFESVGGCEKLERDGFSKPEVFKHLYRCTGDMHDDKRKEIVDKFYRRECTEKGYKEIEQYKRKGKFKEW